MSFCDLETWKIDFVNGDLDEPGRRRAKDHLATCASCRRELKSLASLTRALEDLPNPSLPPALRRAWEDARRAGSRRPAVAASRFAWGGGVNAEYLMVAALTATITAALFLLSLSPAVRDGAASLVRRLNSGPLALGQNGLTLVLLTVSTVAWLSLPSLVESLVFVRRRRTRG